MRVLNLWQRNGIYPPEVISPLVDMAATSSKVLAANIKKQTMKMAAAKQAAEAHFQVFLNTQPTECIFGN